MAEIKKKCWVGWFDKIASGEKNVELRLADFECKPGDTLILEEWDPEKKAYTGRSIAKQIKYVMHTKNQKFWSQQDIEKYGFQVITFE